MKKLFKNNMSELRKGVGALIINQNGELLAFQRNDQYSDSWQGVEGGIDDDEVEKALYREVWEEIGLKKDDFVILNETENFIPYYFDSGVKLGDFKGQQKKFYLLKLLNDDIKFKFDNKEDEIEFRDYKVVSAEELIELVPKFKKDLYKQVLKEFCFV